MAETNLSEKMFEESENIVVNGNDVLPRISDPVEHLLQNDDDVLYENSGLQGRSRLPTVLGPTQPSRACPKVVM